MTNGTITHWAMKPPVWYQKQGAVILRINNQSTSSLGVEFFYAQSMRIPGVLGLSYIFKIILIINSGYFNVAPVPFITFG